MSVELQVPAVGESITEVEIVKWHKSEGDYAEKDEVIVELETDKATVELPAPVSGVIGKILKGVGEPAGVGEVIAMMEEKEAPAGKKPAEKKEKPAEPVKSAKPAKQTVTEQKDKTVVMPAARRVLEEKGIEASDVKATGPGGRLLKEDVLRHAADESKSKTPAPAKQPGISADSIFVEPQRPAGDSANRQEEVVRMTPMRRKIAERLVSSRQNTAQLTTFNEVDMSAVIDLRKKYQDTFTNKYGIKLGFMSFFVKASIEALKMFPKVNAEISGSDIIYKNYYDIGIAVSGGKGLVVPVLRNAELMSFSEVETSIKDFAERAAVNKINLDELEGGTFTISNGGIFGSMLSTPIINPPQSGILGLHAIQDRPVAIDGQVVIRPMMYIALTYDHRIIDGRESVTFLKRIKELIEQPSRILLEV